MSPETTPSCITATSSAAEPVYVGVDIPANADPTRALTELVEAADTPLVPDWDAWAEILAFGAPLAGRTPYCGIRRLQPGESAVHDGTRWNVRRGDWSWAQIEPEQGLRPESLTGEILDHIGAQLGTADGPINPMLSGGRDSRLLTAMALRGRAEGGHGREDVTTWTTSSDIGTSMEELVAAKVASTLGVQHNLVAPRNADFADDVAQYARTVEYMASFHIWLMPLARRLAAAPGPIIDGLGGGVFLGGGFPDDPAIVGLAVDPAHIVESRFTRLARYLDAADEILAPGVGEGLRERAWADFEPVASNYADHPNGATLTAYLTRTLPGISLAPAKVLGSAGDVLRPIVSEPVVTTALRVEHSAKADGRWYPDLLASADARLTGMATAADLSKRRQHVRRGASYEAASWYRDLIVGGPAASILSEEMHRADIAHWQSQLAKTKPQHLLRGLAMLTLWLDDLGGHLGSTQLPFGEERR
ncbi:asparagine synthase-related protein [Brevibacterium aurantiacum]|uniref:Asparagine synthase n=1 Tax=Brevibacterium aurantiacum TaxID=273384 RepID=A0A2H1J2D2_BREAU|nr:asparagine synthase-related protein [Brevibacterium aurantiacum]SMX81627.1 Asparagine synthase [Brevibacterium aurantiacum]